MDNPTPTESLDQVQTRHRRELKDLQGRITGKKKNATKKTRKGVNDECAEMERQLREKQAAEIAALNPIEDQNEEDDAAPEVGDQPEEDKLAAETGKLKVSEPEEQQQQQPGKKRNRQKERMARRAAEQEAAAQRAEEEASNMTNYRAKESEYMKTTFEKHGLVEKDIAPDGHCLFSAVADQLGQNNIPLGSEEQKEPAYKTIRRVASSYMLEHGDDFVPFLEEDLEGYARKMRDTAEWGGQLELMALARQYKAEIRVVQDGRMERIGEEEGAESGKTLWLAYYRHGYGLGEHYNSLRKAP
ncbi:OTU protein [Fusarium torreyae]|uniref:OTU protein n=1 Tax=Fusarium torreyae TaxID=1237075 RepID=A0A9W8S4G7_9HYPO|nr:OTU protein [Fusarium torreyae]